MEIRFEFKRVYGRLKFYPKNDIADSICKIADRLCLDKHSLAILMLTKDTTVVVFDNDIELSNDEVIKLITKDKLSV